MEEPSTTMAGRMLYTEEELLEKLYRVRAAPPGRVAPPPGAPPAPAPPPAPPRAACRGGVDD